MDNKRGGFWVQADVRVADVKRAAARGGSQKAAWKPHARERCES